MFTATSQEIRATLSNNFPSGLQEALNLTNSLVISKFKCLPEVRQTTFYSCLNISELVII